MNFFTMQCNYFITFQLGFVLHYVVVVVSNYQKNYAGFARITTKYD